MRSTVDMGPFEKQAGKEHDIIEDIQIYRT